MEKLIGEIIGDCRLEEVIGQGGMGAVYRAHHQALNIPVAVKIMLPHKGRKDAAARFLKEAQSAARLKHPNIIGVYGVGEDQGWHFIIMEFLDGRSVQELLEERGTLSQEEAVGITWFVLTALEAAVEKNIVHRDLKPDNILIDNNGTVKLADLGLAKELGVSDRQTQTGMVVGSPYYIAPEQANDSKNADHRADIYSLGCIMYHMLSGSPPFQGENQLEIVLKHVNDEPPSLEEKIPEISADLSAVVGKMMEKNPGSRYQTPREVRYALKLLGGKPDLEDGTAPIYHKPRRLLAGWRPPWKKIAAVLIILLVPAAIFTFLLGIDDLQTGKRISAEKAAPGVRITEDKSNEPDHDTLTTITTVMEALLQSDTAALLGLLKRGISPDYMDKIGKTPLHEAVLQEALPFIRILLEKGAKPNLTDDAGDTPLHYAIHLNSLPIVELLLDYGADPNIPDRDGHRPLQMPDAANNKSILAKLRQKGGQ